jgi:hypothetical protein
MQGIVLRQKGDMRLILTVPLINRSVAVEVNAGEVKICGLDPVDSPARNKTEAD